MKRKRSSSSLEKNVILKIKPKRKTSHSHSQTLSRDLSLASESKKTESTSSSSTIKLNNYVFDTFTFYIVLTGIGKTRSEIFKRNINKFGGKTVEEFSPEIITHVIVNDNMEFTRLKSILKYDLLDPTAEHLFIIGSKWLIECVKQCALVDTSTYRLKFEKKKDHLANFSIQTNVPLTSTTSSSAVEVESKSKTLKMDNGSDYSDSEEEPIVMDLESKMDIKKVNVGILYCKQTYV